MKIVEFLNNDIYHKQRGIISLLFEKKDYFEMVQPIINFYQKYPFFKENRISSIQSEVNKIRLRFKRSDIIVFYLSYWRMNKIYDMFFDIAKQSGAIPQVHDYILGIRSEYINSIPSELLDEIDHDQIEKLRMAFRDASNIGKLYLNHLSSKRGETNQSLYERKIIPKILADYLNGSSISLRQIAEQRFAFLHPLADTLGQTLMHFINMNRTFPLLNGYRFDNKSLSTIFKELEEKERLYQARIRAIPVEKLTDKVTPIMTFPDGYAWFDLNTDSSADEANMMGHCCTDDRISNGGTVYSLRKVFKRGNVTYHDSHVTVMVKKKTTYEIKGRGNKKPSEKYHKYLIALLESPLIKRMVGGGYESQNNFMLSDLPKNERKRLRKLKPNLSPILEEYIEYKVSDEELPLVKFQLEKWLPEYEVGRLDNKGFYLIYNEDFSPLLEKKYREKLKLLYPSAENIIDTLLSLDVSQYSLLNLNNFDLFNISNYRKILYRCIQYAIENHKPLYDILLKNNFADNKQMILPGIENNRSAEMTSRVMSTIENSENSERLIDKLLENVADPIFRIISLKFYNELLGYLKTPLSSVDLILTGNNFDPRYAIYVEKNAFIDHFRDEQYDDNASPSFKSKFLGVISEFIDSPKVYESLEDEKFSSFNDVIHFFEGKKLTNELLDYDQKPIFVNYENRKDGLLNNVSNNILETLKSSRQ